MPLLDIPQVVNTVSDKVLEDQHATTLDEALYNVSNVVQTNTLGGTQDAFVRRGFGANRDGSIMTNGLRTVLPRSFNAATSRVEVLKGPASTLYGILDPGGLINVVTKRPQTTLAAPSLPPLPALAAAPGISMLPGRLKALAWRIV
jgi:iron complex outermembrane receptor protein